MITIDQLLESVELDFEPRFVTKDKNGLVSIWQEKPAQCDDIYHVDVYNVGKVVTCPKIKLAEFANKPWTECIYEVPRKTTGKIEKVEGYTTDKILAKINELVEAVNELKGAKNE